MKPRIPAHFLSFLTVLLSKRIETKLVPVYNLRALDDYEVIKDEYKILYKEHLYSLKVQIDNFVDQNELVLFETYSRLTDMLNFTKVDTSGEFVEVKYKLMNQLMDNRDDVMQIYTSIRHKISQIAYKLINFIEHNHVDKNSIYFLEYALEQVLRQCRVAVPHTKHLNVLSGLKPLPFLFLHQGRTNEDTMLTYETHPVPK